MIRRLACPTCRQTHSCSFGNSNTFPTNFSLRGNRILAQWKFRNFSDMLEKQEASDKLEKGNEYSCRHCKKEFHEKNLRKCDTCCPRIQPEESLDFMVSSGSVFDNNFGQKLFLGSVEVVSFLFGLYNKSSRWAWFWFRCHSFSKMGEQNPFRQIFESC